MINEFAEKLSDIILPIENYINEFYDDNKKFVIYDSCSFSFHANSDSKNDLSKGISNMFDCVILTHGILEELLNPIDSIPNEYYQYIRSLSNEGLEIILLKEEEAIKIVNYVKLRNIKEDNENFIKCIELMEDSIEKVKIIFDNYKDEVKNPYLLHRNSECFYDSFFRFARLQDDIKEDLGEILIFLFLFSIAHVPVSKFVFLSDDVSAYEESAILWQLIKAKYSKDSFMLHVTTPRLIYEWFYYNDGSDYDKEVYQGIFESLRREECPVLYRSEHNMKPVRRALNSREFVNLLFSGDIRDLQY